MPFQMSDHLPLWLELKIDFANNYLAVRGRLHKTSGVKTGTVPYEKAPDKAPARYRNRRSIVAEALLSHN
jgi:hypothetical protein